MHLLHRDNDVLENVLQLHLYRRTYSGTIFGQQSYMFMAKIKDEVAKQQDIIEETKSDADVD